MLFRLFMVRPVQGDPLQLIQLRNIYISTIYYYLFIVLFFLYLLYLYRNYHTYIAKNTQQEKPGASAASRSNSRLSSVCFSVLSFKRFNV